MGCLRPRLRTLVALMVIVAVMGYAAVTFVQVLAASYGDDAKGDGVSADAIVVLGAAQWDGQPSPVFGRRLDHAADLYRRGVAPVIVVTGGMQEGDRVSQGIAAYDYLRSAGVPDEGLLVEVDGRNTYTELSATAAILEGVGRGDRVMLVTDGYHARRTALTASEVGLDPSVSPSSSGGQPHQLIRETVGSGLGQVVGFRRLSNLG